MNLLLDLPGTSEWALISIVILLSIGLLLIPRIFYLITLQSAFNAVSEENRKMPSAHVWLLLIPLFGIVWHFIVIDKLAGSISAEANAKGIQIAEPRPAYNIGLAMCILNCMFFIPGLNVLTGIAGLICWILYWVKITSYKNTLLMGTNAPVMNANS